MTLPDKIEANVIPTGSNEPQGIIYNIRQTVSNVLSFVIPSTNVGTNRGDYNTLVQWDSYWQSAANKDAYIQIEFVNKFVFPIAYSLKGFYNWCTAKEWKLLGYDKLTDAPTELSTNKTIESTYCGDTSQCDIRCCNNDWGTFEIKNTKQAYRYFKIMSVEPSCSNTWRLGMSGIEIFGLLSSNGDIISNRKKRTYCFKSYPLNNHLPAYALLRLLSQFLTC